MNIETPKLYIFKYIEFVDSSLLNFKFEENKIILLIILCFNFTRRKKIYLSFEDDAFFEENANNF